MLAFLNRSDTEWLATSSRKPGLNFRPWTIWLAEVSQLCPVHPVPVFRHENLRLLVERYAPDPDEVVTLTVAFGLLTSNRSGKKHHRGTQQARFIVPGASDETERLQGSGENLHLARQQFSIARRRAAHAHEPSPGPQAVRHARDDGNAGARFERRDQLESPESTAGDEQGIRFGRRLADARGELEDDVLRHFLGVGRCPRSPSR